MHPALQFWMAVAQLAIMVGIVVRLGIVGHSADEVRRLLEEHRGSGRRASGKRATATD